MFKKSYIPWNKGLKGYINKGSIKKRQHLSLQTEFKKGQNLGESHPRWKGGRIHDERGYILIKNPLHHRAKKSSGYVYEHILVMEKKIKRNLKKNEIIHHMNGNTSDNREGNLKLCNNHKEHSQFHCKYRQIYEKELPSPLKINEELVWHYKKSRLSKIIKKCLYCKKLFWANKFQNNKFCNHSCAGKYRYVNSN